jgi:hypothetical protein
VICAIKYAIVRDDPGKDSYLDALVQHVDRSIIISGIGERPADRAPARLRAEELHLRLVCVAPRGSTRILALLKAKRYDDAMKVRAAYIPLEDQRDALGPIRVLHDAVTLAGIAEMGPLLPMISNLDASRARGRRGPGEAAPRARPPTLRRKGRRLT